MLNTEEEEEEEEKTISPKLDTACFNRAGHYNDVVAYATRNN
jgi:hypothetical protein